MLTQSPSRRGLRRLLRRRARPTPAPLAAPAPAPATPLSGVWLGEGIVRALEPSGRPQLLLADAQGTTLTAEWALPFRYQPAEGDVLRVLRRGPRAWVLGVVQGQGQSQLRFARGLTLKAGLLRISSDVALRLRAGQLRLRAGTLEVVVETLHEKLGEATRQLGLLLLRAGQVRRVVDGEDWTQAGSRTVLAHEDVVMDAQQLKIG